MSSLVIAITVSVMLVIVLIILLTAMFNEIKKKRYVVSLIALIFTVLTGYFGGQYIGNQISSVEASASKVNTTINMNNQMTIGNDDASVKMIYYFRFTCPNCESFTDEIKEELQQYVDNGDIQIILKLTRLNELMYLNNTSFNNLEEFQYYYDLAEDLEDSDAEELKKNLSDEEIIYRTKLHEDTIKELDTLGITTVPTFYLNDKRYDGIYTKNEFVEFIEELLK